MISHIASCSSSRKRRLGIFNFFFIVSFGHLDKFWIIFALFLLVFFSILIWFLSIFNQLFNVFTLCFFNINIFSQAILSLLEHCWNHLLEFSVFGIKFSHISCNFLVIINAVLWRSGSIFVLIVPQWSLANVSVDLLGIGSNHINSRASMKMNIFGSIEGGHCLDFQVAVTILVSHEEGILYFLNHINSILSISL
jgi:hypothetical protein